MDKANKNLMFDFLMGDQLICSKIQHFEKMRRNSKPGSPKRRKNEKRGGIRPKKIDSDTSNEIKNDDEREIMEIRKMTQKSQNAGATRPKRGAKCTSARKNGQGKHKFDV